MSDVELEVARAEQELRVAVDRLHRLLRRDRVLVGDAPLQPAAAEVVAVRDAWARYTKLLDALAARAGGCGQDATPHRDEVRSG